MNKIIFYFVAIIICVNTVFAFENLNFSSESMDALYSTGTEAHFRIREIRQDPFPANPGESVDVYLKIDNIGATIIGPKFDFNLEYPFTLNPSSFDVGKGYSVLDSSDRLTLKYKLDIDKNAKPGDYEVEFRAYYDNKDYYPYFFKINVADVTTNFDLALQDVTKDGVSVAIANTGKNTASSITVSLNDQSDFTLVGPSSYIIGNLNMGDYTLVNLFIVPSKEFDVGSNLNLNVKVAYTDIQGHRREVEKIIPVVMSYKVDKGFEDLDNNIYGKNSSANGGPGFFFYTTLLLMLIIVVIIVYFKRRNRRRK
jgi:hypothetical protein